MKNKFLLFISVVYAAIFFYYSTGCQSIPDPVDYVIKRGGIDLRSFPDTAYIYVDGIYTHKATRDSVIDLEPGDYLVTLKRFGYTDTSFSVTVTKGACQQLYIVLAPHQVLDSAGPATLFWSDGVVEQKPSGLVLATGLAFNINQKDSVDFFYFKNDGVLMSPHYVTNRNKKSFFLPTNYYDLKDGLSVPKRYTQGDSDWKDTLPDSTTGYFYVYDSNKHYSKIKITKWTNSRTDSASIIINGYYNLFADSLSFR